MKWMNIMGLSALLGTLGYSQPLGANLSTDVVRNALKEQYECEQPLERKLTIEQQAAELNNQREYGLRATDLALLTRVVYMEAGNDPKAKTQEQRERGWEGVAQVMLNRYLFDKNHGTKFFARAGTSLEAIARAPMQFHPVSFFPSLFKDSTLQDKSGEVRLGYARIPENIAERVYKVVVDVLKQEGEDITNGAVFFHADYVKHGRQEGTTAFHIKGQSCRHRFTTQLGTHKFFATTCAIDPYGESLLSEPQVY